MGVTIHIDGLCKPQKHGGIATWAYVATDPSGKEIGLDYGYLGRYPQVTSHTAEYTALLKALQRATKEHWYGCAIYADDQVMVYQAIGKYGCYTDHLLILLAQATPLIEALNATLTWVPRQENERADHLSNVAYDKARQGALTPVAAN